MSKAAASATQLQPVAEGRRDAAKGHGAVQGVQLDVDQVAFRTRGFEAWRKLVQDVGMTQTAALTEFGALLIWEHVVTQDHVLTGVPFTYKMRCAAAAHPTDI